MMLAGVWGGGPPRCRVSDMGAGYDPAARKPQGLHKCAVIFDTGWCWWFGSDVEC